MPLPRVCGMKVDKEYEKEISTRRVTRGAGQGSKSTPQTSESTGARLTEGMEGGNPEEPKVGRATRSDKGAQEVPLEPPDPEKGMWGGGGETGVVLSREGEGSFASGFPPVPSKEGASFGIAAFVGCDAVLCVNPKRDYAVFASDGEEAVLVESDRREASSSLEQLVSDEGGLTSESILSSSKEGVAHLDTFEVDNGVTSAVLVLERDGADLEASGRREEPPDVGRQKRSISPSADGVICIIKPAKKKALEITVLLVQDEELKAWDRPCVERAFFCLQKELPCPLCKNHPDCAKANGGKAKETHRVKCTITGKTFSMFNPVITEFIAERFQFLLEVEPDFFKQYYPVYCKEKARSSFAYRPERQYRRKAIERASLTITDKSISEAPNSADMGDERIDAASRQIKEYVTVLRKDTMRMAESLANENQELRKMILDKEPKIVEVENKSEAGKVADLTKKFETHITECKKAGLEGKVKAATQGIAIKGLSRRLEGQGDLFRSKLEMLERQNRATFSALGEEFKKGKRVIANQIDQTTDNWRHLEATTRYHVAEVQRNFGKSPVVEDLREEVSELRRELALVEERATLNERRLEAELELIREERALESWNSTKSTLCKCQPGNLVSLEKVESLIVETLDKRMEVSSVVAQEPGGWKCELERQEFVNQEVVEEMNKLRQMYLISNEKRDSLEREVTSLKELVNKDKCEKSCKDAISAMCREIRALQSEQSVDRGKSRTEEQREGQTTKPRMTILGKATAEAPKERNGEQESLQKENNNPTKTVVDEAVPSRLVLAEPQPETDKLTPEIEEVSDKRQTEEPWITVAHRKPKKATFPQVVERNLGNELRELSRPTITPAHGNVPIRECTQNAIPLVIMESPAEVALRIVLAQHAELASELKRHKEAQEKAALKKNPTKKPPKLSEAICRKMRGLAPFDVVVIELPTVDARTLSLAKTFLHSVGVPNKESSGTITNGDGGALLFIEAPREPAIRKLMAEAKVPVREPGASKLERAISGGSQEECCVEAERLKRILTRLPKHLTMLSFAVRSAVESLEERAQSQPPNKI